MFTHCSFVVWQPIIKFYLIWYLSVLQADIQLLKKGHSKPGEMAEKAAEVLMGCFRICASDRYVACDWSDITVMEYDWVASLIRMIMYVFFKISDILFYDDSIPSNH